MGNDRQYYGLQIIVQKFFLNVNDKRAMKKIEEGKRKKWRPVKVKDVEG